ncbi:ABC transporter substrate-binding protein [Svornostia abyssi]|uniref:ABC transporter substrate-binding protein n=1 Tax=Svornostia abyssi TaxID=2898438 RepID=A0ABY5PIS0_9ACTN|nr:ABC transporter substrate-binding protein [Parviterribacteraceae bacterium J379]
MSATRRTLMLAFAAVGAISIGACGSAEKKDSSGAALTEKTISIPFVSDMSVPDPDVFYDVEGNAVTLSVYEGLVRYKPDTTEIVGDLAKSWEVSDDKKTYTFALQDGVTFHSGAPMTSKDVKASFERRKTLGQGSSYMLAGVKSMETPDDSTFVINLKEPQLPFMHYLASQWGPRVIGPEALVENAGDDQAQKYLSTHEDGTGPYELTEFDRGTQYTLTAYDGYWGAKPYYTTVNLKITPDVNTQQIQLKGGDLAMMLHAYPASDLKSAEDDPNLKVETPETAATLITYLNTNKAPFDDPKARAAVAGVIDREAIVSQAYGDTAKVAAGPYPPAMLADQPELPYGTGVPAGSEDIGKGKKILLSYAADEVATLGRVSQLLQSQLKEIGYDVVIKEVPHAQVYDWVEGAEKGPDIFLLTNNPDAAHPDTWAGINWGTKGGTNLLAYSDPKVDDMLATALSQDSEEQADEIYREIGQEVVDANAQLFIANVRDTIVYNAGIAGVTHTPLYPWVVDLDQLKPAE